MSFSENFKFLVTVILLAAIFLFNFMSFSMFAGFIKQNSKQIAAQSASVKMLSDIVASQSAQVSPTPTKAFKFVPVASPAVSK